MKCCWSGLLCLILLGAGCAHAPPAPVPNGPRVAAPVRLESWSFVGSYPYPARRLVTPHYVIYSTLEDPLVLARVGQLMEGALGQYHRLSPDVPITARPMECYLFATRRQWADFTKSKTGDDAAIYLRINRGGYTVGDWYVAYDIGPTGTFSVAAHEGWHQYAARHLRGRLPPFLEEGIACMFEDVRWQGDLPRWNLAENPPRLMGLQRAVAAGTMFPLSDLVRMHAGQIVSRPRVQIEAFYAQSWAFARFLWEGEHGRYRPALQRMLDDAAAGTLFGDATSRRVGRGLWDPGSARPMLENYLAVPFGVMEEEYRNFVRTTASHARGAEGA